MPILAVSDGKLFQSFVIATDSDRLLFSLVPMIGDILWHCQQRLSVAVGRCKTRYEHVCTREFSVAPVVQQASTTKYNGAALRLWLTGLNVHLVQRDFILYIMVPHWSANNSVDHI